jgi:DNA-binding Lrp family transcriptional regulator
MTFKLDPIDSQILALLMDDARLPTSTIAKKLAIARTTAIARIAALEKRGVIAGYGLRIDHSLYQPAVQAYVGIAVDPRHAQTLVKLLQKMPQAEALCAVSGNIDYMLTLRCQSTGELNTLLDQICTLEGIRQTSTSIVLAHKINRSPVPQSA